MENEFNIRKRDDVSEKNQQIFDLLKKNVGVVPNLYSTLANTENALEAYFNLETSWSEICRSAA